MTAYEKYPTTVVGSYSVPRWYEALEKQLEKGSHLAPISAMLNFVQPRRQFWTRKPPETIAGRIAKYSWLAPEQTLITSSYGLNHLPRHIAFGKLQAIGKAQRILRG